MSAYNDFEKAVAGLKYGLDSKAESWIAAEIIQFGAACFSYNDEDFSQGQGKVWNKKIDVYTETLDADLVTSNVITTTLTIDGVAQTPVATTFVTDHDTTMDAHVTALEAAFSGLTVTLTDATDNRQFTFFYKGSTISSSGVVTLGASQAGVTDAEGTTQQIFVGVAMFVQNEALVSSVGYYAAGVVVAVMTEGLIWVSVLAATNANVAAYVTDNLTNVGAFTSTSTNNYNIGCYFRSKTTAAGLILLEVRGLK